MKVLYVILSVFGGFCYVNIQCTNAPVPPTAKPIWNATWTDLLKRDLLMTYDKFARPVEHFNTTTVVLAIIFKHFDVDEQKSIFGVHCWTRWEWTDNKLKWNTSDYGNLSSINLAQHEIWQPDILLFNGATGNDIDYYGNTYVSLESSGKVIWVPPAYFQTFCSIDLRYWPFDSHECYLVLGSWLHNGNEIDIVVNSIHTANDSDYFKDDLFIQNDEWEVTKITSSRNEKIYPCCKEMFVDIRFNITVVRRSPIYRTVVIVPATVIIFLTLATFWLPAHYGEKILLNGINAVIIVMFLIYFAQKLNVMALHTPLIVIFYSNALYLVCFSMLISVVVINLTRTKHTCAIPWQIKKNLDGRLGQLLFLEQIRTEHSETQLRGEELRDQPFDEHITSDDHHIIQQFRNDKGTLQQEWHRLAIAIDRLAFILYALIFFFSTIVYSI